MSATGHLHYRYAIAFLVALLISVIAAAYHDVPRVVELVSFALTITSLALALVSIIYAFLVSSRQDTQIATLANTGAAISTASTEIQKAAATIVAHVQEIPPRLDSLDSKLMSFAAPPADVSEATGDNAELPVLSEAQFRHFFINLRYAAMAALLLYVRCYKAQQPISRSFMERVASPTFEVVIGVLFSIEAMGMIRMQSHKGELIPIDCAAVLAENVPAYIDDILRILDDQGAGLQRMIDAVNAAFENPIAAASQG